MGEIRVEIKWGEQARRRDNVPGTEKVIPKPAFSR